MFSITSNMFFLSENFSGFMWKIPIATSAVHVLFTPVKHRFTAMWDISQAQNIYIYIYNIYRDLNMYGYRMCVYIYIHTYIHTCSHMCPRIVLAVGLCSPIYSYLLHTTTKKVRKPKHQPPLHVTSSTRNKCLNNSIV